MNKFGKIVDGKFEEYQNPVDAKTGRRIMVPDSELYAQGYKKVFTDTQYLPFDERKTKKCFHDFIELGDKYIIERIYWADAQENA